MVVKFTPGPWTIYEDLNHDWRIREPQGHRIATAWLHNGEQGANARLIAAAPEMYALLRAFAEDDEAGSLWTAARALLAKIDKETPHAS